MSKIEKNLSFVNVNDGHHIQWLNIGKSFMFKYWIKEFRILHNRFIKII